MPKKAPKQPEKHEKQTGISWKTVFAILGSIATLVGAIVSGLDFIQYLRAGYQEFLWLGAAVFGLVWLIVLWLLFKQRNIYGLLWLAVTVIAVTVVWTGWNSYIQAREAKLIILIAKFDDTAGDYYALRNTIMEQLNADFASDSEVKIETINDIITPDSNSGSTHARELGKSYQADVVIWGWYRATENPYINIHIENLAPNQLLPLQESEKLQPAATSADLESFSFQQQTAQETSVLISFLAGFIDYRLGNYKSAIEHFDKSQANLSAIPLFFGNWEQIYFYRANANYLTANVQGGIKDYDQTIQINPEDPYAYNNRGNAYVSLSKYRRAIQDYDQAIQIDPQYAYAYYNRGNAYAKLDEYQRAIQDYDLAIQINPQYVNAYNNRGLSYDTLGEHQRAIQDFDQAIRINPQIEITYNNRGNAYDILGEHQRAIQDYDQAIRINPQSATSYINRGVSYYYLGEHQRAIQDYDLAIQIDPRLADAYRNRGLAYQFLDKTAEAEADFAKYKELTGQDAP